ncbi:MAG TPA: hypothetical protein VEI96_03750 [Thermodesulfovibrionales bacterium]|nr:hypothetical protein [Thermodesulfovibrionales bacterium]
MAYSRKEPKPEPLLWVVESLQDEPSYLDRSWFGCRAVYLHGLMVLVLCSGEEPWNGLLLPTDRQFHAGIVKDYQGTVQHPVLKKWLYLPKETEDFETVASDIVEAIRIGDKRFGIEPAERERTRKKDERRGGKSHM